MNVLDGRVRVREAVGPGQRLFSGSLPDARITAEEEREGIGGLVRVDKCRGFPAPSSCVVLFIIIIILILIIIIDDGKQPSSLEHQTRSINHLIPHTDSLKPQGPTLSSSR